MKISEGCSKRRQIVASASWLGTGSRRSAVDAITWPKTMVLIRPKYLTKGIEITLGKAVRKLKADKIDPKIPG
jgi:hypothetical protein